MTVAVKEIHTKDEIATFKKEVETLSRVKHKNIVKLYGASTQEPCYLVMEYADGGSLYDGQYIVTLHLRWSLEFILHLFALHKGIPI